MDRDASGAAKARSMAAGLLDAQIKPPTLELKKTSRARGRKAGS
jgi:hypothetical protein